MNKKQLDKVIQTIKNYTDNTIDKKTILTSPNGTKYILTVDDNGNITSTVYNEGK